MPWYKSWLDTRWRFLLGGALLAVMACGNVFEYTQVHGVLATLDSASLGGGGAVARAIEQAAEVQKTFRGYVWYNWFGQGLHFVLLAALLGSGSAFSRPGRGLWFTLALPAPRSSWLNARAGLGAAQLLACIVISSVVFVALAPAVGEHYAISDALVHSLCAFVAASVPFVLATLFSTLFDDLWRPLLLTCLIGAGVAAVGMAMPPRWGLRAVMSARAYFEDGSLPWIGLVACVAVSAALWYAASANVSRRDF